MRACLYAIRTTGLRQGLSCHSYQGWHTARFRQLPEEFAVAGTHRAQKSGARYVEDASSPDQAP